MSVTTAILVVFTVLVVVGALKTLERAVWRVRHGYRIPELLWRDLAGWGGLAWAFVAIFAARALELGPTLAANPVWTYATSIPPIFGAAVYVYCEFFVIRRPGDGEPDPQTERLAGGVE